jgi:hypothetical protein
VNVAVNVGVGDEQPKNVATLPAAQVGVGVKVGVGVEQRKPYGYWSSSCHIFAVGQGVGDGVLVPQW